MGCGRTAGGALGGGGPAPGAWTGLGPRRSEGLGEGHTSVESGFWGAVTVTTFSAPQFPCL